MRLIKQQRRSLCSSLQAWPPQFTASDILPRPKFLLDESEYYTRLLQECNGVEDLPRGKTVHARLAGTGLQRGAYVGNNLVSMYSRCGSLSEAYRAFQGIKDRDVVTWNVMIAAFAHYRHPKQSFAIFHSMLQEGVAPSQVTFMTVLNACSEPEDIRTGRLVHSSSFEFGIGSNVVMATALVNMYGKCGSLEDAVKVFEGMDVKTAVSYNALMVVFTRRGYWKDAVRHFLEMQHEGIKATNVSFVNVLNACSIPGAPLSCGKLIHAWLEQSEHAENAYAVCALISMYTRHKRLNEARKIFDGASLDSPVAWNSIIGAYSEDEQGSGEEAFSIFRKMQLQGLHPDKITFLALLSACASLEDGQRIHRFIQQTNLERDVAVGTALITMYGKCKSAEGACEIFNRMKQRNLVSWTAVITACGENGLEDEALYYFRSLLQEGVVPNRITFISLLNAFAAPAHVQTIERVRVLLAEQGLEKDVAVSNVLLTSYGKCGSELEAKQVFDTMKHTNIISWNSIMRVYVQKPDTDAALLLFRRMLLQGVLPDWLNFVTIFSVCSDPKDGKLREQMHSWVLESGNFNHFTVQVALLNMYGQAGDVGQAETLLQDVDAQRDIVPWNALISAYAVHGYHSKAFQVFHRIHLEGSVRPDKITFINMLHACTGVSSTKVTKLVHSNIQECGLERESGIVMALAGTYATTSESLAQARELFDNAADVCNRVSWNGMLSIYARHGHANEVLKLMRKMEQEGVKQDRISFKVVLSTCSHAGYLTEGFQYFNSMAQDRSMEQSEEHYACMIDLLARAGKLDEAAEYARRMPSEAAWTSLLSASKLQRDVSTGKLAANRLLDMDPEHSSACVVMHSIMRAVPLMATETW